MRISVLGITCAFIMVTASNFPAFAAYSFTETYGVSIRSMSLGGAFTAIADDYAAIYYNTAGLAQTKQTSISLAIIQPFHNMKTTLLRNGADIEFTDTRGIKYGDPTKANDGDNFNTHYPIFGLSLNINRLLSSLVKVPINIQAGVFVGLPGNFNHMFSLNTTSPDAPTFIAFGDKVEHFTSAAALGLEIKKDLLYLGIGTFFGADMAGKIIIHDAWIGTDVRDLVTQSKAPVTGVLGYTSGLLFTPFNKKLKIGVSYREEIKTVSVLFMPVACYLTPGTGLQNIRVHVEHLVGYVPEQFSFGLAYSFNMLTVSIDGKIKKWNEFPYTYDTYTLYHLDEQELIVENPGYEDPGSPDFDEVTDIGVGLEYRYNKKLTFTAGYELRPTPVPDQSYRISNYLDMDKDVFSFGVSYKFKTWMKVESLFQYMLLADFKVYKTGVEDGYSWGPQESYEIDGDALVFGISVEFTL